MSFITTIKKPVLKIDKYLLENHPLIWEVKLHWVLYFVLLTHLVVGALVLLMNVVPDHGETIDTAYSLSFIPIVLAIGAWVTVVVRFNLSNENGRVKKGNEIPKFLAVMLTLALIFSTSYVVPITLCINKIRASNVTQLKTEIDALNEGAPYFVDNGSNSYNYDRSLDTCVAENFCNEQYFNSFSFEQESFLGIKNSNKLKASCANTNEKNVKSKIANYIAVSHKYDNYINLSVDSIYVLHQNKCSLFSRDAQGQYLYMGPDLKGTNPYEPYRFINDEVDMLTFDFGYISIAILWVYFIFILAMSLLINILKSFRWQSFILLPVFFIPFIIISSVVLMLLFSGTGDTNSVMTYFLLVYIFLVVKGIKGAHQSSYSWFSAISLMMAQLGVAALPPYILLYCSQMKIMIPGLTNNNDSYWNHYHIQDDAGYIYFWIGFALLIITLPYFRALQIKYNALPRAK